MAGISTNSNATPRPHDDYFLSCILKIAAAFSIDLSESTQAVYLERLRKLTANEIHRASERTISEWDKSGLMPPLAFILARTSREPGDEEETERLLQRPAKPSDWEELGKNAGVSHEDVLQWLEEGKAKQRAHIAKLEADPRWQEERRLKSYAF